MFEERVLQYSTGMEGEYFVVNTVTILNEELDSITEIELLKSTDVIIANLPPSNISITGEFGMLNLEDSPNTKVNLNKIKGMVALTNNSLITNLDELIYNEDVDIRFFVEDDRPICGLCKEHVKGLNRIHLCARLTLVNENEARDRINTPLFKIR